MGRKPLLAIAGALLAGVTLSGCETGRPYYDGPRAYLPSQGYRGGPYAQSGMMYSQPQMVAGAAPADCAAATSRTHPIRTPRMLRSLLGRRCANPLSIQQS